MNVILHLFVLSLYMYVLIIVFCCYLNFSLPHLSMCYICDNHPTVVGWESDNSDAVREAVSAEVKSYGCQW